MSRSNVLAALVLIAALGGLATVTLRSDDASTVAADGSAGAQEVAAAGARADTASNDDADDADDGSSADPDPIELLAAPPVLDPKPELTGLDGWLQSDATDLSSFDGQVRIVQFWTFGCHNCKATLPHLQEIYADHRDEGLEIIGVHAPEFSFEADVDNIAEAAADLGVTWPIALDTNKTNFRAWQGSRRFWPRTYVLDREGQVRFDHIGEGKYDELAQTVRYLLAEEA